MPRKKRLIGRKRGTDPRRTRVAYMQSLIAARHAEARKRDRKAYDEYWAATFLRLFPNA